MKCKEITSREEGMIEEAFRLSIRRRGIERSALDSSLVGVALHILGEHKNDDFSQEMYGHIAAIHRGEIPMLPVNGDTVDVVTWRRVKKFIETVSG